MEARIVRYGAAAEFPHLKGMTTILVDDGLANEAAFLGRCP